MEENGGKVRILIEKATNSTAAEVDPRFLKAIKSVVRHSDSELRLAAETLMDLMKRDHSQVRYLTLLIIDELFMRSKLFRTIVVENLDQLLSLSVGFRRNYPLPAPQAVAAAMRKKAIEFLEKWNSSFGVHYRQIRLGFDYLKYTLRLQFPNLQANAARIQQERREREMRTKEILLNKFETLKENFSSIKEEIQSTVDEIVECLEIVRDKGESLMPGPLDVEDEEFEGFHSSELRQIRLDSLKEGEKIHESAENKVVFDTLRELYKLLVSKHMVSVQEWISVLIRVELADNRSRDSMLKELIDTRNRLQSTKKKCMESGCALPDPTKNDREEEEDFWEEGKIESTGIGSSSQPDELKGVLSAGSTCAKVKSDASESGDARTEFNDPLGRLGGEAESSSLRTKLLAEAPSVRTKLLAEAPSIEWSSFLDNWGSRVVLANQRGLELDNHWGRVDPDAVIPAKKIAELNLHSTVYKEDRDQIQPCRAPLRKGGLCQRSESSVCPFHGPIVPRDDEGNPIYQGTPTSETTVDLGADLAEQLAKQAVKNVRDRDNEESRKRKMDKHSQKRAKLAKIREHNEAVLKDAALASTSRSAVIGEDVERTRNKKETLASMLRKKVTTKDRLAQKLLNTRTSEATVRQLSLGEDTNYREAFPNQW
ncbi:hypothetical protein Tsubulata_012987 [Turnera subulata]|uniref:UV-stimulated scaffold protein A C-terminal domain-containing protein n=1 Tax=Turnera subulata TaxID=218843 RepID=A0A9Q0FCI8_9ROSI|nr:hypothetical protein Tsubulata_012987 [Turnera subulata]